MNDSRDEKTEEEKERLERTFDLLDHRFGELEEILSGLHGSASMLSADWKKEEESATRPDAQEHNESTPIPALQDKEAHPLEDEIAPSDFEPESLFAAHHGEFKLENTAQGLYLTVEGENPLEAIQREIERRGYEVDLNRVREVLEQASGMPQRIAGPQYRPSLDGRVEIRISTDRIRAYLILRPPHPGGLPPTEEMALTGIENSGVKEFSREAVKLALVDLNYGEEILIARGKAPRHGTDGALVYDLELPPPRSLQTAAVEGRVDHREGGPIIMAHAGDRLVYYQPPVQGAPGLAVTGEEIPPRPPKDTPLISGKNTRFDEDTKSLYAAIDGQVIIEPHGARVEPVFHVKGDVDYSVGNIEFGGTVQIDGVVLDEFRVKAGQDVIVKSIGKAYVQAGGNITVQAGIISREGGRVEAGRTVTARFIENATVSAGEHIVVGEAVVHSQLRASGHVVVTGKRGALVGGRVRCGGDVWVKNLGTEAGTGTVVEAGVNPSIHDRMDEILPEFEKKQKLYERIKNSVKGLKNVSVMTPRQRELLEELRTLSMGLREDLAAMEKEVKDLRDQMACARPGRITALEAAHPGIKLRIREALHFLHHSTQYVTFALIGGEIKATPAETRTPLELKDNER